MTGAVYKATLEDKFNDDYEPVRCALTSGQPSENGAQSFAVRRNSHSSKKKKKVQHPK